MLFTPLVAESVKMAASTTLVEDSGDVNVAYKRPVRLSLHLIVKRHLPTEADKWSQERIITELNKIHRVRLDRENIGDIDSMELLGTGVTNLYLQSNQIKCIENLECLPNLQVLVLSQNQLTFVDGISHLQKLVFLDISENQITDINTDSFPKSVVILNLKDNPCTMLDGHREELKNSLPKLKQLNEVDFIDDEIHSDDSIDEDENSASENDEAYDERTRINDRLNADGQVTSSDPANISLRPNYRQLPTIPTSIPDMTAEMLLRSQIRLEEVCMQHKQHIQEMTNIKIKSKIRPLPSISKPE